MKKLAISAVIFALCTSTVFAAQQGGFSGPQSQAQTGGFVDQNSGVTTVSHAKEQRDGAWVTLRGHIIERLSDDSYTFKDASSTIKVDIDQKIWNGITITPQDLVEIQGEVDKDFGRVEIDVKQLKKVTP
ncbi:TIGR00156 family protein [Serratia sp. S1B]|nr:TIGR00156 family protein [Serratia sp. S1B]